MNRHSTKTKLHSFIMEQFDMGTISCEHQESVDYYCRNNNCQTAYCDECCGRHAGHGTVDIEFEAEKARTQLSEHAEYLRDLVSRLTLDRQQARLTKEGLEQSLRAVSAGLNTQKLGGMQTIDENNGEDLVEDLWFCQEKIQFLDADLNSMKLTMRYIKDKLNEPSLSPLDLITLRRTVDIHSADNTSVASSDVEYDNSHLRSPGVYLKQPTFSDLHTSEEKDKNGNITTAEGTLVEDETAALAVQSSYFYNRQPGRIATKLENDYWYPEPMGFALCHDKIAVRDPTNQRVKIFDMNGKLLWSTEPETVPWIKSMDWWSDNTSLVFCDENTTKLISPSGTIRPAPKQFLGVIKPFLIHRAQNGWLLLIGDDNILNVYSSNGEEVISRFILQKGNTELGTDFPKIINDVDVTDRRLWDVHVTLDEQIVASFGSYHYIHAVSLSADTLWVHGKPGTSGTGANRLNCPWGMCNHSDGSLLVADSGNNRVIKLSTDGQYLGIILGPKENLLRPRHIAMGDKDILYVKDMDDDLEKLGDLKVYTPIEMSQ